MHPAWLTFAPARESATDWFSPLPPNLIARDVELSVSPGRTK